MPLEIKTEPDSGFFLSSGTEWWGLRVYYREENTRGKWQSIILLPDEGETMEDLVAKAEQAATIYAADKASGKLSGRPHQGGA